MILKKLEGRVGALCMYSKQNFIPIAYGVGYERVIETASVRIC